MLKRTMYRSLLRLGKDFDRNPNLKAFVYSDNARFLFDSEPLYMYEEEDEDKPALAIRRYVEAFCGGGTYYRPSVSLTQTIRSGFRETAPEGMTDSESMDLGFLGLRLLSSAQAYGSELTVDPPATTTTTATTATITTGCENPGGGGLCSSSRSRGCGCGCGGGGGL
mmetsp:Transcript_4654/g.10290  ORF Transcript_4654/g.10290 Transcript_4654/m.10290 type:complete len:167 (+) Transcript_4654:128-628(+)